MVRKLKSQKAVKLEEEIDGAVKKLLDLKAEYKALTGTDFPVTGRAPAPQKKSRILKNLLSRRKMLLVPRNKLDWV